MVVNTKFENIGVAHFFREVRRVTPNLVVAIALLTLFAIGLLYFKLRHPPKKLLICDPYPLLTSINRKAIQDKSYLTRILFYGSKQSDLETSARKMAHDLGLKFQYFDGRELGDRKYREKTEWYGLLQRIASASTPEFVFISHADEVFRCGIALSQRSTILTHTGSPSKTLLLCLGFTSLEGLDPAVASRYRSTIEV